MDTLNVFPYVRAALIGHATRDQIRHNTRGGRRERSCQQLYKECPAHQDEIVDYLNNHNGGIVKQVSAKSRMLNVKSNMILS